LQALKGRPNEAQANGLAERNTSPPWPCHSNLRRSSRFGWPRSGNTYRQANPLDQSRSSMQRNKYDSDQIG
jgi:hypothetical protein